MYSRRGGSNAPSVAFGRCDLVREVMGLGLEGVHPHEPRVPLAVQGDTYDLFGFINVRFICRLAGECQELWYYYSAPGPARLLARQRAPHAPTMPQTQTRQAGNIRSSSKSAFSHCLISTRTRVGSVVPCHANVEGYCFSNAAAQASQVPPFFSGIILAPLNSGRRKCDQVIYYLLCVQQRYGRPDKGSGLVFSTLVALSPLKYFLSAL